MGCSRPGTWRATLVALQRSGGDLEQIRITLPIVVCSWHKRHALELLVTNPRGLAAVNLRLSERGKAPLDWSTVRLEFSRVQ